MTPVSRAFALSFGNLRPCTTHRHRQTDTDTDTGTHYRAHHANRLGFTKVLAEVRVEIARFQNDAVVQKGRALTG